MVHNEPVEQSNENNSFDGKFIHMCETTFKELITFDFNHIKMELENRETDFEEWIVNSIMINKPQIHVSKYMYQPWSFFLFSSTLSLELLT